MKLMASAPTVSLITFEGRSSIIKTEDQLTKI